MVHSIRIHTRLAHVVGVMALASALLVPAASATSLITDTLAPGGSPSAYHTGFPIEHPLPAVSQSHGYRFVTDTLAPGGSSSPAGGYSFITDTLAPGGGANGVVSAPTGNGFSWADAGIGGLAACGLMLLALTGRQLVGRKRRGQLAF